MLQLLQRKTIQRQQKLKDSGKSERSHFSQQLQVVVMGHAHRDIAGETAELRIDLSKYAQTPSQDWLLCEHFQCIAIHFQSCSSGQLCPGHAMNARHTVCQFATTEPGQ